jgi:MYXO-CTERM domain-containing protein
MKTARRPNAPLLTGLGALIAIALALPLLAPSCSDFQPGQKLFAKGSLIIPMDVCYQYLTDGARASYTPSSSCPGAVTENGDVIKAYGLVYQLIRNGVAVYWIIDQAKGSLTAPDLTLQFTPGLPVLKYDWTGAAPSVPPNTDTLAHTVKYLGGPFIVDGSDAAKATQIFQKYKSTFRPTATTGVNVHVANIAFTASVAKMLAGGWSAGGATPPKLALLNIGSSGAGAKNSEVVIRGYLQKAGLDISEPDPLNPTVLLAAGGSATGVHGTIYDRLAMEDFLPSVAGNVLTSNLFKNGYQILWVPHWAAPSSCSDCPPGTSCTCANKYPAATIQQALQTIGAFGAAGKDIFAECAGLGSFEGVVGNANYGAAVAETHFQTVVPPSTGALAINTSVTSTPIYQGHFSSPLMQLGDYPFIPLTGAIQNYKPTTGSSYVTAGDDATVRLISESGGGGSYDIFTHRPKGSSGHGTFVYLGGHSYSGTDGTFEIGGTRLVLNTLFNLGAGCTESGVACDTGLLGKCGRGVFRCDSSGKTYCAQTEFPSAELCNGIDDNCNGLVDEGLDQACYDGPAGTNGVGVCHGGIKSCVKAPDGSYGLSECQNQVLPSEEVCNGLDDNCNGFVDEDTSKLLAPPPTPPANPFVQLNRPCYDGDPSTLDPVSGLPRGVCKAGIQACNSGSWGACAVCSSAQITDPNPAVRTACQILPRPDDCTCAECSGAGAGQDWNCDGAITTCTPCTAGASRNCYTGPAGTAGVGLCHAGTQSCDASGNWATCLGEVKPLPEICNNGIDENCNGMADDGPAGGCGECVNGATQSCYDGPVGTAGVGICKAGTRLCANLVWGPCGSGTPQTLPGTEVCDGLDNNCNGTVDDGAQCGPGFACRNGVCVYDGCGPEIPCAEGFACVTGHCQLTGCGGATPCAPGSACTNGACANPNDGLHCGPGSSPAGGFCTGGACYEAGCPAGKVCLGGACVADPCSGVICPGGTFCRQGDCVQACAFITCAAGQRCDVDGFCVTDRCAGVTCSNPTQICVDGPPCVTDPCSLVGCGRGQACSGGVCIDDPCTGILCPTGQCLGGQCYAVGSSAGTPPRAEATGCGCATGGVGTPLALLALLAMAPLARRRRPGARSATLLGFLLLASSTAGCKKAAPFDPASCTAPGVGLTTCPGEDRCVDLVLDPSHCGACDRSCQAGETCVDKVCGPGTSVAPLLLGAAPATLPRGGLDAVRLDLTGERFVAGATVRATHVGGTSTYTANVLDAGHLSAFIDLKSAAPDTWQLRVVNPDRVISNQRAIPVVVPTPTITSITPSTSAIGALVTVQVVGSGFMFDSLCFIGGSSITSHALPVTLTTAGLDCDLDLSTLAPGSYDLWVANPVGTGSPLSSNKVSFLATSNAAPVLDSLSPTSGKYNTIAALSAYGSGFDVTSRLVLVVRIPPTGAAVELEQTTSFRSSGELFAPAIDLTRCPGTPPAACPATGPAASYAIKVKNTTGSSGSLVYSVDANPPSANSLAPTSAYQGDSPVVIVTGTNLAGGVLQYQPPGGAFVEATATSATATTATGTIDLVGVSTASRPAGTYQVRLRFATGVFSATLPFSVISNTAILQSISPASGLQGQNPVTVTFTVPNLRPPTSGVKVVFSARPAELVTATPVTATTITAPLDLRTLESGPYTLVVMNPNGAAASNPANFTVIPGPPSLTSVTPASAVQQVALLPLVLAGTNFARPDVTGNNGSTIHLYANCAPVLTGNQVTGCTCSGVQPCIPDQVLNPAFSQVTVTSSTRIDVLLDTTAALPATYSFWVWNPGGSPAPQRSNPLAFTVSAP